jgi:DamX protein
LNTIELPIYVLQLERGGEPWFVVLVGDFASQSEARKTINNLPQKVRNLQPWARPVIKLQQQLVNKMHAGGE